MNNKITERMYQNRRTIWLHRRHLRGFGFTPWWKAHEQFMAEKEVQIARHAAVQEAIAQYEREEIGKSILIN